MGKTFKDRKVERPPTGPSTICAACGQPLGKRRFILGGTADECCSRKCCDQVAAEREVEA